MYSTMQTSILYPEGFKQGYMKECKNCWAKYYGAPLNRITRDQCRRDMIVNNIDMVTYTNNIGIKIIESKHINEKIPKSQLFMLGQLSKKYNIRCFIVIGNGKTVGENFRYINGVSVYSMQTGLTHNLNENELINFIDDNLLIR